MIRNIIFDMGRVLIGFDPLYFIERIGITGEEDRDLLMKSVFNHPGWRQMDAGLLTESTFYEIVRELLPERLHAAAYELIFNWNDPIIPIEGMADLLNELKEKGYHLYLLSNASVAQPEYWKRIPGSECFEGTVISALEKVMKPDVRIYQILLKRYGLKAEECIFIDDVRENCMAAEDCGILSYQFKGDVSQLREFLRRESIIS